MILIVALPQFPRANHRSQAKITSKTSTEGYRAPRSGNCVGGKIHDKINDRDGDGDGDGLDFCSTAYRFETL